MLSSRRTNRAGFTLIEILAVIGIMLLLISIFVVTMGGGVNSARVQATRSTIQKVDGLLRQRIEALNRWIERERTYSSSDPKAPIEGKKQAFLVNFPQTRDDLEQDDTYATLPTELGNAPSGSPPGTANSELLYWFLTSSEARAFSAPSGDVDFTSSETADVDGDGHLELVDSWGRPIRFYRWPTRLLRSAETAPLELTYAHLFNPPATFRQWATGTTYALGDTVVAPSEPDSQLMYIRQQVGVSTDEPSATQVGEQMDDNGVTNAWKAALNPLATDPENPQGIDLDNWYHDANTWHAPMVVSAGPDGVLGIQEPDTTDGRFAQPISPDPTFDNITNLNLQAGNN